MKSLLDKMLTFCVEKHSGQFDKGGKPYILHCLAVMHKLRTEDEELQCIALGHDVIEDTDATYEDLHSIGMTVRIISGIAALTKQRGETYNQYKRKVMNNDDAILVKMADLQHNSDIRRLKGVTEKDIQRVVKYQTFWLELNTLKQEKEI